LAQHCDFTGLQAWTDAAFVMVIGHARFDQRAAKAGAAHLGLDVEMLHPGDAVGDLAHRAGSDRGAAIIEGEVVAADGREELVEMTPEQVDVGVDVEPGAAAVDHALAHQTCMLGEQGARIGLGLERHLGLSLAVRHGRTVRLTDAGIRLAHGLEQGFGTIASCLDELHDKQARRALRITASPFLVDKIVMPRMSEFWESHPGAEISLHPSRQYMDIVQDGFDLAIRAVEAEDPVHWPGLEAELITRVPLIAIAGPTLIARGETDPSRLPWFWHDVMSTILVLMRNAGLDVERLRQVRIGSPNLQLEAVRQGIGVTIFNEQIARQDIEAGRVVEVPLPRKQFADYFAVTPKGPKHPLTEAFVTWITRLL
jgi:LysR family glycine cleavage system transcriptional activator